MLVNQLVHTVGLLRNDVHDSTEEPRLPGKVNVNLDLKSARGHAGKPGPVPSDRTTPLEAPTLEVGPLAFNDPISLRGTVLHEFEHVHHTEKAIAAVERWRATEPKLEFAAWLEKQKESGQDLAARPRRDPRAGLQRHPGDRGAGLHARLHGHLPPAPAGRRRPLHVARAPVRRSGRWAGHAVQDETVAQLLAYRETLDPAHRAALDAFVAPRRSEMFWNRFPE